MLRARLDRQSGLGGLSGVTDKRPGRPARKGAISDEQVRARKQNWLWGMAKSGGGKMQAARQKRAATGEPEKGKRAATNGDHDVAALQREAERLREELANERERVKTLEHANSRVAERLDAAIESVKAILARSR